MLTALFTAALAYVHARRRSARRAEAEPRPE